MRNFCTKAFGFILILLAVFAGLVALKYHFSDRFSPGTSGIRGLLGEQKIDNVFIGSSLSRQGYDMDLFQKKTGTTAYLVAYNGMSPFLMEPLLRFLSGYERLRIKTFVLEIRVPGVLAAPSLEDTRLFCESPVVLKNRLFQLFVNDIPGFGWQQMYELVVLSGNEKILTFPVSNYFIERASYRGGYAGKETGSLGPEEFRNLRNPMSGSQAMRPNPRQLASLEAILRFAKEKGLDVIFVAPPLPKPIEEDAVLKLNKQHLGSLLRERGFAYLDGAERFDTANHLYFADSAHLSTAGRRVFTEQVAEYLSMRQR
jgi:hypothetical protein